MTKYKVIKDISARTQKGIAERVDIDKGDIIILTRRFMSPAYGHEVFVFEFGPNVLHFLESEVQAIAVLMKSYNDIWNELNG